MGIFNWFKNIFSGGSGGGSLNNRLQQAKQMIDYGKLPLAKESLACILEEHPDCLDALILMGDTLGKLMEFDGAVSVYKKAIELSDNKWEVHGHLASVYHEMGNLEEAAKEYNRAIELNPKYGLAYMNLGALYFNEGNFDGAIVNYKKALELLPKESIIHSNIGKLYVGQGLFDDAICEFQKALKIDENDPVTFCEMGTAYYYKGDIIEAIIKLKHAITLSSDYSDPHYLLGMIYEIQNNPREASRFYLKYLNLEPKGIFARDATAWLKKMGRSI